MKILVDELPETPSWCFFAEWRPYPPCVEDPGYYACKYYGNRANCRCTLSANSCECRVFKKAY